MTPTHCPRCGQKGRKVHAITPRSLLREQSRVGLGDDAQARFCKTATCPVVYFLDEQTFTTDEVSVPVYQKSSDPDRAVCYCFDFTVAAVAEEVRATGRSHVPDVITEKCRQGRDRCEEENPQGSCCLGNVRAIVKAAQSREPVEPAGQTADSCCTPPEK